MATSATDTSQIAVNGNDLTFDDVERVAYDAANVVLTDEARTAMQASREFVERTAASNTATYGLNTGVGRFVDTRIPEGLTGELQRRVLRSHAAGVGDPYPREVTVAALLLRINTLARGYSGVRPELVERFVAMLNAGIVPHVPARGSVGASGDLAPLAHLALPLIGEGKAWVEGELLASRDALERAGLAPLELASKEGLSLINGTQLMSAMGVLYAQRALRLMQVADLVAALTVEALRGSREPFLPQIHALRPLPGQVTSADNMYRAMEGSGVLESHRYCDRVQDAYALRCAPQVHGASRDALAYVRGTLAVEINSVTDNPIVFAEDGAFHSNGNFHGQPLAIALDTLAIAVAEIANISERRIERLVNPAFSGLPAFLTAEGGLNSGYMIAQYTAASLVSENKVLCHPASVDSIPTSAGQEDHVSMGNHAGLKLAQVLSNAEHVVAIELMCAAQGVEFLGPRQPGVGARAVYSLARERVPTLEEDRVIADDIGAIARDLTSREFAAAVQERIDWQLA